MFLDLHTHILHAVDDGSPSIENSILMLQEEINEGVTHVVLTPHMQSRVQKVERTMHHERFQELQDAVQKEKLPIRIYLGAETLFRSHLNPSYDELTLGHSRYILLEFSTREEQPIEEIVYDISRMGFIPIVAHIERYSYLSFDDYAAIKKTGALIQVNTTSILGLDKTVKPKLPIKMIKEGLVDLIASDTHNLDVRKPNMMMCYQVLKKHVSQEILDTLFISNPQKIITAMS
jgi:protein-tyrosine phosphatase